MDLVTGYDVAFHGTKYQHPASLSAISAHLGNMMVTVQASSSRAGPSAPRSLSGSRDKQRSGSLTKPLTPRSSNGQAGSSTSEARKMPASEMKRAKPTFTTCRTYPENAPAPVELEPGAELQRNQRRSKVQAISKLDRAGTPLSSSAAGPSGTSFLPSKGSAGPSDSAPGPSRNPLHRPPIINPPFKLADVRTQAPRHPEPRSGSRPFNLPECPVFYPTPAEFSDPLAYIAALPLSAKEAGICKVVPPIGWRMPFSIDQETFRFKTRLQRLNSLEATSRAKLNFLEQLTMFHLQQGDSKVTIPLIDRKPLDLWRLRKEVTKMGGYEDVQASDSWRKVAEVMGHDAGWGPQLGLAYKRIVYPFDTLSIRAKTASLSPLTPLPASKAQKPPGWTEATPGSPTRSGRMGVSAGRMGAVKKRKSNSPQPAAAPTLPIPTGLDLSGSLAIHPTSSPQPGSGPDSAGLNGKMRIPGFSSNKEDSESELSDDDSLTPPPPDMPEQYQKGEVCEVCRKGNFAEKILLCDGCDRGFHIFCLDPPLASVPANEEWFCTPCLLSQGDDYGFEEGEEHSMASFSARDAAFSGAWWSKHRPSSSTNGPATPRSGSGTGSGNGSASPTGKRHTMPDPLARTFGRTVVSEDDVEREFWRLTESNSDTVEVEYGADVHSTTHGSAAPTLETHPLDPYAKDGWNLNNMPILQESLLRYIKSDISGMTVPWIYIGMMFSTFCWHNEDHYTYSINYMYWGETKTWYGIPGADAEKFETAIKAEAPELFEQQPSLLYQLVTMMNPGKLVEQDVRVLACDQRPNEFVITFPKAYHCGFNHGINFNEAVNFALPDWLPEGKESVVTYRKHAKPPVFSHHELLISITLYSDTIKTALWVRNSLAKMVAEETAQRESIRKDVPLLQEILVEEDCPEEQYQCCICKGFCYLSQITCTCTKLVACIDHADSLCRCAKTKRVLRKRYSEAQLEEILADVQARAAIPGLWRERFMQVVSVPRPPLKSLRGLLADGERIAYPIPEVDHLRAVVIRANAWVEKVTTLATRKAGGRRRKGQHASDEEEVDRSPEHLAALLSEADRLAFDAPEVLHLRHMLHSINSFQSEANFILSRPAAELDYERCQSTLILGQGLQIDLPEIAEVEQVVKRLDWYRKVENEVDDRTIQYDDVVALLSQARACAIPETEQLVQELVERERRGRIWKSTSEQLLASRSIHLADVEALIEGQELTPTKLDTMLQLETIRKTAVNWQTSAQAFLAGNGTATAALRLCKNVKAAQGPIGRVVIPEMTDLQAELDFHADWLKALAALVSEQPNKVTQQLNWILGEIKGHLDPSDDLPNDAHACFCRNPATAVMVTCETCLGIYHPKCLDIAPKNAAIPVKCPMCLRGTYDDRPSLNSLAMLSDPSKWNFILVPAEMATLRAILEKGVEFSRLIIPLVSPYTNGSPGPDPALITHCARKLFTLPIALDAVNTKTNERVVFEDWLFKGMREARQPPPAAAAKRSNRPRRAKLVLAESKEKEFSCICDSPPVDQLLQVRCGRCEQGYHLSCKTWRCPCCAVKEGKLYLKNVELRVQDAAHDGTNVFIDYRQTVASFVDQPIYIKLPPNRCILLHCTEFIPAIKPDGKPNGAIEELDEEGRPRKKTRVDGMNGDGSHAGWRGDGEDGRVAANGYHPMTLPSHSRPTIPLEAALQAVQAHRPVDVYRPARRSPSSGPFSARSPLVHNNQPHTASQSWAPSPPPPQHQPSPMDSPRGSSRLQPSSSFTSNFPRSTPTVSSSWRPPSAAASQSMPNGGSAARLAVSSSSGRPRSPIDLTASSPAGTPVLPVRSGDLSSVRR
ncbi:PLU-1-like protein-domain-containing protein [Dioszegia hungarica]|uniref:[histone H3]-trimethyl-L-lysine(4) demethylase n=1 Tax=Dioszegia hungarica TaxID=4972 RepID=A0AA38LU88_9TREE|nr:PLU-1-like protein-domain-containing protein [Dioszegia hungarica]KAI9635430.1 PLU-1-like protein-domain-containing protein [Dioszegia hungarica]